MLLTNNFHNTHATVKPKPITDGWYLTARQVRRAWLKLCGMADCHCSGDLGARGPQEFDEAEHCHDGGTKLFMVYDR